MIDFCCDKFKKYATEYNGMGIGLYPFEIYPESQFEYDEKENNWNINGCCGGGCFVVTEMIFCPFCGFNIIKKERQ